MSHEKRTKLNIYSYVFLCVIKRESQTRRRDFLNFSISAGGSIVHERSPSNDETQFRRCGRQGWLRASWDEKIDRIHARLTTSRRARVLYAICVANVCLGVVRFSRGAVRCFVTRIKSYRWWNCAKRVSFLSVLSKHLASSSRPRRDGINTYAHTDLETLNLTGHHR